MPDAATKVLLTRIVSFSSGHRYWLNSLSEQENRDRFGQWASKFSHGHNYKLEVSIEGAVDPITGMVVNIKTIDDVVRRNIVSLFDGKSLNDEVPFFFDHAPSVENILAFVWRTLKEPDALPPPVNLVGLKLEETPELYGELMENGQVLKTTITRSYEFAASHRLHAPALDQLQNIELFGKCNNLAGHGHNFVLEVTVEGEPDERTGMIANIVDIDAVVESKVVGRFDHKNLNVDIPEFRDRIITSEVLAQEIFSSLMGVLPAKLSRVRLFETARSWFEVSASA